MAEKLVFSLYLHQSKKLSEHCVYQGPYTYIEQVGMRTAPSGSAPLAASLHSANDKTPVHVFLSNCMVNIVEAGLCISAKAPEPVRHGTANCIRSDIYQPD